MRSAGAVRPVVQRAISFTGPASAWSFSAPTAAPLLLTPADQWWRAGVDVGDGLSSVSHKVVLRRLRPAGAAW